MKNKSQIAEFELGDLVGITITFVIIGIAVTYGVKTQSDVRSGLVTNVANCGRNSTGGTAAPTYTSCGLAYNASGDAILGTKKISDNLPTIGLIVVAAVIIGILVRYLLVRTSA